MREGPETTDAFTAFEEDSEARIGHSQQSVGISLLPPDLRCFGGLSLSGPKAKCKACEFADACKLVSETEPHMDTCIGGQDIDSVSEFAVDLADCSQDPSVMIDGDAIDALGGMMDDVDAFGLADFLNTVLRLDPLSLGTIAALFESAPDGSFPALKKAGVRLGQVNKVRRIPELAKVMGAMLLKIGVARQAFKLHPGARRGFRFKELRQPMGKQALKEELGRL